MLARVGKLTWPSLGVFFEVEADLGCYVNPGSRWTGWASGVADLDNGQGS